ncbi:MAG: hypothetical protein ACW99Q_07270 [Candidatus Kariarchaeaceae archaeon]|jgi:hypothetical protein
MSYTIKTYEESFIEKQVEIGVASTKNWVGYNMSSAESIKNSYSQENFDPETRLYAFKDDKMVGFLTCYIAEVDGEKEAHYRLPIMLDGHEEAANQLIEKSIEVLKNKGAKKIITGFGDDWGNHKKYTDTFNFEVNTENTTVFALTNVSELTVPEVTSDFSIEEIDLEKHKDALIKIFVDGFGLTKEGAENNFNLIKSFDQNNMISHSAIFRDGEIIGRLLLYKPYPDVDSAYLGNIFAPKDDRELIYDLFMNHVLKKSREKGVELINKTLLGDNISKTHYEKYGFKFDHIIQSYTKHLN